MPNGLTACQMWAAESHIVGHGVNDVADGDSFASMRTQSIVTSDGHDGDGSASMRMYSTPAKSSDHAGDGLIPHGLARPEFSDVETERLIEEVDFLPTHTTSNPRFGKVFTVETHHQRVEQALRIKGLDKNSLLRSGEVMIHYVESGEKEVLLPPHTTSNPSKFSASENKNKSHEKS
eukprot:12429365-Karenia_brevis.AAC.1